MKRAHSQARGSVRIIGGDWRGRRMRIPQHTPVRPTPDRVRETLFNWLGDRLSGARCLDLYAGTGCLGFEALSRGAAEAWLVEHDPVLAEALAAHTDMLAAHAHVVCGDARRFLERPFEAGFDIVFVDPPYDRPVEPILEALPPRLASGALIYIERPAAGGLPDIPEAKWLKRSSAASVAFGLLRLPMLRRS